MGLILIASVLIQAFDWEQRDAELFQEAKINIFDKEWENAQEKLEELVEDFPDQEHVQTI